MDTQTGERQATRLLLGVIVPGLGVRSYGGPPLRDTWPAIVIAAGVSLILSAARGPCHRPDVRSVREI